MWIERGGGYLFSTSSAAGLLTSIGSVTYAVSKHAAVALAAWISITYVDRGIKVTVLCPQAVRTPMTAKGAVAAAVDGSRIVSICGVQEYSPSHGHGFGPAPPTPDELRCTGLRTRVRVMSRHLALRGVIVGCCDWPPSPLVAFRRIGRCHLLVWRKLFWARRCGATSAR